MTPQQIATLKADILSNQDPAVITALANGDSGTVAEWYNQTSSPSFTVWKTLVSEDEIMQNGFDWVRVDNLSVGKARIWEWMFGNASRAINPSKANVRLGIDETWKGTAADLAVRAAVYVHCKRLASRVEKLFATGTGSDETPATMAIEGPISINDISEALAS
jgi:hypothetical protein